uniref:Uncharacterized protein n=1 Tax=Siphoviridae sp. ctvyM23 TaxID=2826514 RepID=A0A8S5MHW3_9CAUD|nr:MAG TPA: hypothetical protein [Siphoviridae sp. ctvyM23]
MLSISSVKSTFTVFTLNISFRFLYTLCLSILYLSFIFASKDLKNFKSLVYTYLTN